MDRSFANERDRTGTNVNHGGSELSLLCRVGRRKCAIPIVHVVETMRPLPIERIPTSARFVLGLAVIRGSPVPVVDAAALLGLADEVATRYVMLEVDQRRVALAVAAVEGVEPIPPDAMHRLPALLADAGDDMISALASIDADLLFVLRSARVVSETLHAIESGGGASE